MVHFTLTQPQLQPGATFRGGSLEIFQDGLMCVGGGKVPEGSGTQVKLLQGIDNHSPSLWGSLGVPPSFFPITRLDLVLPQSGSPEKQPISLV